jgi:hypothetical protein
MPTAAARLSPAQWEASNPAAHSLMSWDPTRRRSNKQQQLHPFLFPSHSHRCCRPQRIMHIYASTYHSLLLVQYGGSGMHMLTLCIMHAFLITVTCCPPLSHLIGHSASREPRTNALRLLLPTAVGSS